MVRNHCQLLYVDLVACLIKTVSFLKIRLEAVAVVESPEDIFVDMLHNSPHRSHFGAGRRQDPDYDYDRGMQSSSVTTESRNLRRPLQFPPRRRHATHFGAGRRLDTDYDYDRGTPSSLVTTESVTRPTKKEAEEEQVRSEWTSLDTNHK